MPTAFSILPDRFADGRHETIERGLRAAGWCIERGFANPPTAHDVLVTWTVHRGFKETSARAFEAAGGRVIVCEEAYIHTVRGERHFALALHDHNGAGRWPAGGPERWESFGIELKPWCANGRHILVREQRGIGSSKMASPPLWHDNAAARLKDVTTRPVVFRAHPKSRMYPDLARDQPPLDDALAGCHAVVTWASGLACQALINGVPAFVEAPRHVLDGACNRNIKAIDHPRLPDRRPAFERLAWAQWSVAEIARGEPFRHLLGSPA